MGIAGAFPMPRSQPVPRPDRKGGEVRHLRCARPSSSGSPRISGAFGASLFSLVVALVRLVPRMVGSGPRSCHPPLPSEVYETNARHTSGLAPARSAPGPNQPSRNCLEQRQPLGRGSDYRAPSWVREGVPHRRLPWRGGGDSVEGERVAGGHLDAVDQPLLDQDDRQVCRSALGALRCGSALGWLRCGRVTRRMPAGRLRDSLVYRFARRDGIGMAELSGGGRLEVPLDTALSAREHSVFFCLWKGAALATASATVAFHGLFLGNTGSGNSRCSWTSSLLPAALLDV